MVLSYDERVELLKKARQAKADKKLIKANEIEVVKKPEIEIPEEPKEAKAPKKPKTPKEAKAPKTKEATKTLDISKPTAMPDFVDSEPEVEEQIIYKPKEKKKKKIIRKIIMEESSDDEDVEIIEEIIKKPKKQAQAKERKDHAPERPIKAEAVPPKPVATPVPQGNMFFNF